ncbi:hypothetical protein LZP73_16545 [Shewanella sp. AS16]|uniref:hypothetical protein n=1 Tax=Shewanella sp. AS16 TaxID=2907625 RepID=UPI001F25E0F8|nr:hypothetical protein [Shewanella sp. AS16]MCE9687791.1 hypothetical protein [Shewanella sp. AS16]
MKRFNCNRLIRALGGALISTAALYAASITPANASFWELTPPDKFCMADAFLLDGNTLSGGTLNCTANDVEITKVVPLDPNAVCTPGQVFTFDADVTVKVNANERYDTTFYLPLTSQSPKVVHGPGKRDCSLLISKPGDSGMKADVDLDGDVCGDITKKYGPDSYVLQGESLTMLCADEDGDNRADFHYCAAWDNQERNNCTLEEDPFSGQVPNTRSKCNCDTFNIDVFIKPNPPVITKTLVGTGTYPEPGGEYTFNVNFTNTNAQTSIFITGLSDEIDSGADGSYETSLDLWGATGAAGSADGIYLTASNCTQPVDMGNGIGEIAPSGSYSCQFKVHIVDSNLPDDQSPELYDDLIKLALIDKNGDPVTDGDTCSAVDSVIGDHCSNVVRVNITNLPPSLTMTKTADPDQVPESGADVTYTIRVNNTSADYDSPLEITSLMDDKFGNLDGKGTCAIGGFIPFGGYYECSFVEFISASGAGSHTNTATAKGKDNEGDEASGSDSETVQINDIPSMITMTKTADPIEVLETGDDPAVSRMVNYTFEFSVDAAGVDTVTFSSLTDTVFGDITGDCMVDMLDGNPIAPTALNGFMLMPGHSASCTIAQNLTGDAGDVHVNVATIDGVDEDGQAVEAMDDATVTFIPGAPATDMAFAASMLVVLELHNAGIENVNLTLLTVGGINVFAGADEAGFRLINGGGNFDSIGYLPCDEGHQLGYNGSGTDTYSCAFTIEFKPGLENTLPINFLDDVVARVEDNEGDDSTNDVSIQVMTAE